MRHLSEVGALETLRRGKPIEQFLGRSPSDSTCIRYIELRPSSDLIEVWVHDVADIGGEEFLDLYEFQDSATSDPETPACAFEEAQAAATYAYVELSASANRWVNQSVTQSEYLDFIRLDRPDVWPPIA
ncbi:MAG: hypothetical protein JSS59_06875 [Proteobacteria bacterium]|uniref:hypothetical protein n=1 Tax=Rudaea sp. TaxID=2136325 RepID=UPI0037850D22|nr:hypothetical protein [Pseudomonadota bacterium]